MDKTLLEEIKNLIKTSILGESAGDDPGTFDRFSGGWHMERSNSFDPASRTINQDNLRMQAANQALKSSVSAMAQRPNGEYEATYSAKKDTISWSPALLGVEIQSGKNISITPETNSFLENLIGTFKEATNEDGDKPAKINISRIDVKVDNEARDQKKNSLINLINDLINGLSIEERSQKAYLSDIRKIISGDERFYPPDYQITIEAKNDVGTNFNNVIDSVESFYADTNSMADDFSKIRSEIENSHSRVVLTIKRKTTLLPLYVDYSSRFVPRRAKIGALAKFLWACNQYKKIDSAMAEEFLKWREANAKTDEEKINLARIIAAQLENQYVNFPSNVGISESHKISMDPQALIQMGREIGKGGNRALAITSDTGWSYVICSKRVKNSKGKSTFMVRYNSDVSKNTVGRCTTDFLEGQTTKNEYIKDLDNLGVDPASRSKINDFVLNDTFTFVYTLKMMYGDTVDVRFETDLPKSVYDKLVKLSGGTNISSLIKVPGSQFFTNTRTHAKNVKGIDGTEKTIIFTEADDIINKGSGSAGFLKYINGHKQFGDIDDLSESAEDFVVLGRAIATLMEELYCWVDDGDFEKLKNGQSIDIDATKLKNKDARNVDDEEEDDQGNDNIIDPTNSKIASILSNEDGNNPILLFPTNEGNINKKIEDFHVVHEIVRQLQTQCSKVIGRLVSDKRMSPKEANEQNIKLADITTGLNQLQAGFPTNVRKIYEGILQTVQSTSNYTKLANDTLIDMNIGSDLGKMLKAYFLTFGKDKDSVNFVKYKGVPALFGTNSKKLNFGNTRKRAKKANRSVLVKNLIKYYDGFYEEIMSKMSNFYEKKMTDGEVEPRGLAIASVEVLHYLYDWYKTIYDLTKMDGRLVEMKNLLTVDVNTAMISGISVSVYNDNIVTKYPGGMNKDLSDAIKQTLSNAKKSDIIQGIAISDYCKTMLSPAVRIIKKAISDSDRDHDPIVFSPTDSEVPMMPIHTIVTTVNHSNSEFDLVVLSSVIGFSGEADGSSDYDYTYDDDEKEIVVKNKNGSIGPSADDVDIFKDRMEKVSNAHFIYAMMDRDSPVSSAFTMMNDIDQRAKRAYYNMKDFISENFDLSKLLVEQNRKRTINDIELEAIATKIMEDTKIRDEFMTILKYMYMMAMVVKEF